LKEHYVSRLIKNEDLNHHGTLFAGRTAEWFVEACFIAAADLVKKPESVVCLNIHGLIFKSPVKKGEIIRIKTKVAQLGSTRIIVYGTIESEIGEIVPIEGFITFICVDEHGQKMPHGLCLDDCADPEEMAIRERAKRLV